VTIPNTAYKALPSLPLMIWLSPAFPVGGFAYSHALEWAAEAGDLADPDALQAWLADLIGHGAMRNDAILLSVALQAARDDDTGAFAEANELALALAGSRERFVETSAQGDAFRIAIRSSWRNTTFDRMDAGVEGAIAYPVAVGLAAGAHGQDLGATLDAYLTATISNLTSAAIRLSVIGQTDAQRIIMQALPAIRELAAFAAHATLDDVGASAFRSDIAAMRHETQNTRLFRT
jgi:urease accessory protein